MAPRVSSYYNPEVIVISPNDTLAAARKKMIRYGVRRLIVVDEESRPIGVLTVTDIADALLGRHQTRPLDTIRVAEVMNRDVITIEPTKSIKTAAKLMLKYKIGGLPVVDAENRLIGIITKTDLLRAFADRFRGHYKVNDLKRPAYAKANPGHSVYYLWRIVQMDPSGKIIIVDENERPIGVVTRWDLATVTIPDAVLYLRGKDRYRRIKQRDRFKDRVVPFREYYVPIAESIMSTDVITTRDEVDAAEAAEVMYENRIGVLPVVDDEGVLTGIVTKREYLIAIANKG
ncbi:MAG: CBS domain-containing protein [Desulfurococcales archaeon]|nr:CBS domain-containing protein [Desulfurococcales archaeon]